ncbi:DEAD/DEAH box helicase [Maribacter sp. ACAM166]|uniref:DEAD/DEAH box helicase n=1 Tax=Maribacter sp. ACAM166 TaxID=2508996 RepID=UPI0010FD2817|nr:DEAD/DEAH box helicase [Maribacter sp. ACAM166]TLP79235.1 DEAD/DEAH box helicase [Maribacter sp. ACAM166]
MSKEKNIPTITVNYNNNGSSVTSNELGMRAMQELAYEKRGEQYLLIKSPPASGKSRALMFIALDKLNNQDIKQVIIAVPEKSIGSSFNNEPLSKYGFYYDWEVTPKWNLCNSPGEDGGKVKSVKAFLESTDKVLVCTHATLRFAVERFGVAIFDDRLIAIDEFHHVSASEDNVLGSQLKDFIERDKVHIVAMTGSYFRGDANPVLMPDDELKFVPVTYTYYEQLSGYEYLKTLNIGYYFYSGAYTDDITKVLNPEEKTIIHIPNVNSRESIGGTRFKQQEVDNILNELGEWEGIEESTGFNLIKTNSGKIIKVANLVDDDPSKRPIVQAALRMPEIKSNRDHVDIIIALGMAKEGFDWIWCEHALTIGYRSSLTEIVQIIGRATRDAPNKTHARFTNLIAEVDATEDSVTDAVNDTLKAISASLLMEQVLIPKMNFKPKNPQNNPEDGYDYGEGGYDPNKENVGWNEEKGEYQVEIKGLAMPEGEDAKRICKEDLNEVIAAFAQDKEAIGRGLFDEELVPQELTQVRLGKIIKEKYPEIDDEDIEAIRQHAIAALNITQMAKQAINTDNEDNIKTNTSLIDGIRKFALDVRHLDVDWIDSINPFSEAYSILSKAMNEKSLKAMAEVISAKKPDMSIEDARVLARRALKFKNERGRLPDIKSADPYEQKMAQAIAYLARKKSEEQNG